METFGKRSNYEEKNIEMLRSRNETYKIYKHINMRSRNNHDTECLNMFILVGNIGKQSNYEEKNIAKLRRRNETYETYTHIICVLELINV